MMDELNALIDKAEAEGKWLWCHYQDLWFSPAQLREENRNGKFRWGPVNWKLRDPQERSELGAMGRSPYDHRPGLGWRR